MTDFKIAAAQIASVRGNIDHNVATHAAAITTAGEHGISVLVFPEMSLTGYELDLAADLAMTPGDFRLAPLATLCRQHRVDAVVGAPLSNSGGKPSLGAILFTAEGPARTYSKMHLGGSEPDYFAPGESPMAFTSHGETIGIAICADSSQPSHPQTYADSGAAIYGAGVFLNAEWYATDAPRLADYATRYRMLVVMANHGESVGTYRSVGRSAIWAPNGVRLAQAEAAENCLVIAAKDNGTWRGEIARL